MGKTVTKFGRKCPRPLGQFYDVRAFTMKTVDGTDYGVGIVRSRGYAGIMRYGIVVTRRYDRKLIAAGIATANGDVSTGTFHAPDSVRAQFAAIRKMGADRFRKLVNKHLRPAVEAI